MQFDRPTIKVRIEPLGDHHNRAAFCCGNDYIDVQFHRNLVQQQTAGLTRAFAAVGPDKTEVLGFYALKSHEIATWNAPEKWAEIITEHTLSGLPAAYISLFATHQRVQGRGIGRMMMADALRRIKRTSTDAMGLFAIVLDAIDQKACDFYSDLGFQALDPNNHFRMFYPVANIP